jgi:hypothetical protein
MLLDGEWKDITSECRAGIAKTVFKYVIYERTPDDLIITHDACLLKLYAFHHNYAISIDHLGASKTRMEKAFNEDTILKIYNSPQFGYFFYAFNEETTLLEERNALVSHLFAVMPNLDVKVKEEVTSHLLMVS